MRTVKSPVSMVAWLVLVAGAGMGPADAAEFRLRSEAVVRGPVVTLGDLAEVLCLSSSEGDRLAQLDLFPAPPVGQQRYVRVRELQDLLLTRGVNLTEHRFSGSSQVLVTAETSRPVETRDRPLASAELKKANGLVQDALLRYLRRGASAREAWTFDFRLDDSQIRAVLKSRQIGVKGGTPPFTGSQRFELTLETADGPAAMTLDAQVSRPPTVVVALHSLSKGTVVHESDVQLVSVEVPSDVPDAVRSLDDVLGRETTRSIPEGRVVDGGSLRRPLLVQRGDPVTVYARSSGIRVRTMARAKEDGAMGDLISLESIQNRASFFARVTGFQEADVFAHAMQADDSRRGRNGR